MINTPKLAIAMGYIDDDLVSKAAAYVPTSTCKPYYPWKYVTVFAACIALILGIRFVSNHQETPPSGLPNPGALPAFFYLNGYAYTYDGHYSYELPDGFEFVGEVKNVGDSSSGLDFEGNVDGYIYMSESDSSISYFQWKEWDEEADGRELYLKLCKRE